LIACAAFGQFSKAKNELYQPFLPMATLVEFIQMLKNSP
jgi:hypothetical protein